jgi:hypothetical protein
MTNWSKVYFGLSLSRCRPSAAVHASLPPPLEWGACSSTGGFQSSPTISTSARSSKPAAAARRRSVR